MKRVELASEIGSVGVCVVHGCVIKGFRIGDRDGQIMIQELYVQEDEEAWWKE